MFGPALTSPVRDVLDEVAGRDAVTRLFDRDAGLWGADPGVHASVASRLGWLDTAPPPRRWREDVERFAARCHGDGLRRVLLCGMGGSALAPYVLAAVAGRGRASEAFTLLDSTHPAAVRSALGGGLDGTLVVVSSKSGTTVETRAMADYAGPRVPGPAHLAAVTDPGTPLEDAATAGSWREVFRNPADIGGRFSGLSLVGIVPAAVAGLPLAPLWEHAGAAAARCAPEAALERNPGAAVAAFAVAHARAGRDKLTFLLAPELAPLGLWVEQLLAESTGKRGTGIVPVVGEPVGAPEAYAGDRAFVEIRLGGRPVAGARALADAGWPLLVLDVPEPAAVAGTLFEWMVATALAGALLEVDPFDEPDVGAAKEATGVVLSEVEAGADPRVEDGDLAAAAALARPGDYLAVEAFLPPEPVVLDGLARLQAALRGATGCAVTAGLGPRYLHSTGQLHKGGPGTVVVVHLLDGEGGEAIPGWPFDFGTLLRAQAAGDLRALRGRGRRAAQVRTERSALGDLAAGLGGFSSP